MDKINAELKEDISAWDNLVQEIKQMRKTFDTSESQKQFSNCCIDYEHVQFKVNQKYDTWQKDIINRFSVILRDQTQSFYSEISQAREQLEQQQLDVRSTKKAVKLIIQVQGLKKNVVKYSERLSVMKHGQKLLERQRFSFPTDWIYIDHVDGEWSAMNELLKRKETAIEENTGKFSCTFISLAYPSRNAPGESNRRRQVESPKDL